jgi:transcriptional regulator with XRE-family HTH domain
MSDESFPVRLRASRKSKGYTQAQVAEAIGVTVQAVSQWETGQSGASHARIELLAQLLGVDWDWLGYGAALADPSTPQTINVDVPGDFRRAPLCTRGEIEAWARKYPELNVDVEDSLEFEHMYKAHDIRREWFEPRFAPTGVLFAINVHTPSMFETFQPSDAIICDTGILPSPGDYVVVYTPMIGTITFRRYRQKRSDSGDIVIELVPENPDYPVTVLEPNHGDRILATMVEHRRYRRRRGKELLDFLNASRRGHSSET